MDTAVIISLTLSTFTSIIAIIAPIITTIVNNKHQRKIRQAELIYEKRYNNFKKFYDEYSNFLITKQIEINKVMPLITDCLLIASEDTARTLNSLKNKLIGKAGIMCLPQDQLLEICVKKMKHDLNIL